MPRLNFKHSEHSKKLISAAVLKRGGGDAFILKTQCPFCGREMSFANLGKHKPACLKTNKLVRVFGRQPSTAEMKVFERCLRQYDLSTETFLLMMDNQNWCCAICGRSLETVTAPKARRLANIDHDHGDQRVRGALCINCNTMIGLAYDDTSILSRAIRYLSVQQEGAEGW